LGGVRLTSTGCHRGTGSTNTEFQPKRGVSPWPAGATLRKRRMSNYVPAKGKTNRRAAVADLDRTRVKLMPAAQGPEKFCGNPVKSTSITSSDKEKAEEREKWEQVDMEKKRKKEVKIPACHNCLRAEKPPKVLEEKGRQEKG